MSLLRALALSRAPAAALMAVGVLWGGFAALVPDIKASVGASDGALGLALLMSAVGGMLAMAVAPRVGRALGRWALPVAGGTLAVAFLYPAFAWNVPSLAVAMFAMGATVALLDISANVEISAREAASRLHLMNVNHAMFSFAFAATAYGTGLARQAGFDQGDVLPVLALVGAAFALLMWDQNPSAPEPAGAQDGITARAPWLVIGLTGVMLFASFIGENATEAWSALHIERTLGAAPGEGSLGPAMLGFVMGIGRLFGQVVAERVGHARLIFASALLGMTGTLILAGAPSVPVAVSGVAVIALGMAAVVPSANSMLGARVTGAQRAHALSRAWMVGIFGFFIGPAMMGGIAELVGLRMSFVAVSFVVALILPAVVLLQRQPKP